MPLSDNDFSELLNVAKKAALAAGKIIGDHQGREIATELKEGGTSLASQVVTEVDLKAEKAILDLILPTCSAYDLGLLTEESPDDGSRFEKEYFWCIDPLDGTLPFSRNQPGYGTSIALVSKEGKSLMGVVYNPREGHLYHGLKNKGAFKDDQPLRVESRTRETRVINEPGGAVIQAITAIEESPCVFYKRPKPEQGGGCLWDFAATSIIIEEAGGHCSDFSFRPLNLNSKKSLFINHCGVIYSAGLSRDQVENSLEK